LIGEYNIDGIQLRKYGYAPNSIWTTNPLFVAEDTDLNGVYENYFIINEHFGKPTLLLRQDDGLVVWKAEYSVFGRVENEGVPVVHNNLRFPGQYYDEESNLHYNYHRYYDPSTGRYIKIDPFGAVARPVNLPQEDYISFKTSLETEHNPYLYAGNNPMAYMDPYGTFPVNYGGGIKISVPLFGPVSAELTVECGRKKCCDKNDRLRSINECEYCLGISSYQMAFSFWGGTSEKLGFPDDCPEPGNSESVCIGCSYGAGLSSIGCKRCFSVPGWKSGPLSCTGSILGSLGFSSIPFSCSATTCSSITW